MDIDEEFTAPTSRGYFFRCDVHPSMNGTVLLDPWIGMRLLALPPSLSLLDDQRRTHRFLRSARRLQLGCTRVEQRIHRLALLPAVRLALGIWQAARPGGGHWSIHPVASSTTERRYEDGTLTIVTELTTPAGTIRVVDALAFARTSEVTRSVLTRLTRSCGSSRGSAETLTLP